MNVVSITQRILLGIKFFFDVARLIPGFGNLLSLEPIIEDGLALAVMVEQDAIALMATPEWAKFLESAQKFMKDKGAVIKTALDNPAHVTEYIPPPHNMTPIEFNNWEAEHRNDPS